MIIFKKKLTEVDSAILPVVDSLHYAIGSRADLMVLAGKVTDGEFKSMMSMDQKFVARGWGKFLKAGSGVVVAITTPGGAIRRPMNKNVTNAIEWVLEQHPDAVIDHHVNERFVSLLISIKKPIVETYSTINTEEPQ